ncbi:hypothetical protein DL766_002877 [Monosporascus sp. MC13-8B]|uniref:BZIP domain-containing protein n=1 Tax=Monosporascus cannonballus TaxID=155416 RepID=A0ABY0H8E2_9PEZI|nr:hypothetical protein DL762_004589 [Monosporascus cannonballus]RYO96278.1 hypothetical protein DL763_003305 [Monosporascus cannonballus]RYP34658.1 hypothetical protein DL766_002877 [Monosporascus sp. MC13-8B]
MEAFKTKINRARVALTRGRRRDGPYEPDNHRESQRAEQQHQHQHQQPQPHPQLQQQQLLQPRMRMPLTSAPGRNEPSGQTTSTPRPIGARSSLYHQFAFSQDSFVDDTLPAYALARLAAVAGEEVPAAAAAREQSPRLSGAWARRSTETFPSYHDLMGSTSSIYSQDDPVVTAYAPAVAVAAAAATAAATAPPPATSPVTGAIDSVLAATGPVPVAAVPTTIDPAIAAPTANHPFVLPPWLYGSRSTVDLHEQDEAKRAERQQREKARKEKKEEQERSRGGPLRQALSRMTLRTRRIAGDLGAPVAGSSGASPPPQLPPLDFQVKDREEDSEDQKEK